MAYPLTALLFGASGQDGYYLNNLLEQQGIRVIAVARSQGAWMKGDVGNMSFVEDLVKEHQPAYIFHFAANSTTRHDALFENHHSIVTGSLNILEACYRHSRHSRIFLSGSAVQFENRGEPINEATPFAPLSPYAVSRIASVYAGRYYRSLGQLVYIGYFFNHDSPLRTERHVNQKIMAAVKRIAAGSTEVIEIGDISTRKEFNFAGDTVEAVWKLVNGDIHFEAVIGSGIAYSIEDWIRHCFDLIGKDWKEYVIQKEGFVPEYGLLVSDPRLIKSLGWEPKTDIKGLAALMYQS